MRGEVTVRAVAEVLVSGDLYPDEAIASSAWPRLLQAGRLARPEAPRRNIVDPAP